MIFSPQIEQWRPLVTLESAGLNPDLILAIIDHESRGTAGVQSRQTTKRGTLPRRDGSSIVANHAMGLMQVIPSNWENWNKRKSPTLYYEDATGKSGQAARLQVRIGVSILKGCLQSVHRFNPVLFPATSPQAASDEHIQASLLCYAVGQGNVFPRIQTLLSKGYSFDLNNLERLFPKWGYSETRKRWINRPIHYVQTVWNRIKNSTPETPTDNTGFLILIPLALLALYAVRKKKK